MDKKVEKAKIRFWEVVDSKILPTTDPYLRLREGIDYMLNQLPAWGIDRVTKAMKNWKPKEPE